MAELHIPDSPVAPPSISAGFTKDEPSAPPAIDMSVALDQISGHDSPLSGIPRSDEVVAYPISDPAHPWLLAEFAANLILHRNGKKLVERQLDDQPHGRPNWSDRGDLRFYYFGEIVHDDGGSLTIGALTIRPWPNASSAAFRGITMELLRAISPSAIVERVAKKPILRRAPEHDQPDQNGIAWAIEPILSGAPHRGRYPTISDERLKAYALRYLALSNEGIGRGIHKRLAAEFGITAETSREWTRKAKTRAFLSKDPKDAGRAGRAGALPGPRLATRP